VSAMAHAQRFFARAFASPHTPCQGPLAARDDVQTIRKGWLKFPTLSCIAPCVSRTANTDNDSRPSLGESFHTAFIILPRHFSAT
jgi:hypothetical protein